MYKYSLRQSKNPKKRVEWSINFIHALRHYSNRGDAVCAITDLIISNHWCTEYYDCMLNIVHKLHSTIDAARRETLSISEFTKMLKKLFPFLEDIEIERLMDAARRDTMFLMTTGIQMENVKEIKTLGATNNKTKELYVQHMFAMGHRSFQGASFGIYSTKTAKILDVQCIQHWPESHSITARRQEKEKQDAEIQLKKEMLEQKQNQEDRQEETKEEVVQQHKPSPKKDTSSKMNPQHATRHHTHHEKPLGFVALFCHHYLHHVKKFHTRLAEECEKFNFTGSGKILAHFVPVAIDIAANGQLNVVAIETLVRNVQLTHVSNGENEEEGHSLSHHTIHSPVVDIKSFVLKCQHCLALPFVP